MKNVNYTQRGSATVFAIIVMIFLSIVIAGLLPMLTQEIKAATSDRDVLQAQYAAEAGAKRAVQQLDQKIAPTNTWTWLGSDCPLITTSTPSYNVTLSPLIDATNSLDTSKTYTVTSIGKAGKATKTVTVVYKYTDVTPLGPQVIWTPLTTADYKNTIKYAVLADGDLTAWSDTGASNSKYGNDYRVATTKKIKSSQVQIPAMESVNNVDLKLLDATFFKPSNYGTFQENQVPSNFWDASLFKTGKYYIKGDLSFNMGTPLTTSGSEQVFYYVDGNVNISTPLNGNFVIIAEGDIQLNSVCTGFIQLYGKKNIKIYRSVTGYGVFMALQHLTVTQGTYNKAFMFGDNSVTLSGAKVTGAVYSRGTLTMNGGAHVEYDNSAIPQ